MSSAEEFQNVMNLLVQTSLVSNEKGRQEFVELAIDQAELNHELDPLDKDNDTIDRIICCIRVALPYISVSILFVSYQLFLKFYDKKNDFEILLT